MNALHIIETAKTPGINLDKVTGQFQIEGRSLCDNAKTFYQPAIDWMTAYSKTPNADTNLIFKFEYLDTESSKSILDFLTAAESVKGVMVTWYFNEDDEDMEEIGEELAELVSIPFQFIPQS